MLSNSVRRLLPYSAGAAGVLLVLVLVAVAFADNVRSAERFVVMDTYTEVPLLAGIYVSQEEHPVDHQKVNVIRAGLVLKEHVDFVNTRARALNDAPVESTDGKTILVVIDPAQAAEAPSYGQPFTAETAYLVHTKRQSWNSGAAAYVDTGDVFVEKLPADVWNTVAPGVVLGSPWH